MKLTKLLALILSICLVFACVGCNPDNEGAPSNPEVETPGGNNSSGNNPGGNNPSGNNPGGNNPDSISPINVIMVNDNHGVLNEEDGGIDKIATGINYYASLGGVIKIANGDMFQGTYVCSTLRGLPMLDALNALDFDAFVIGNHEFDWGLDEMKKYKDGDPSNGEAEFPFLGANIYDKNTGKMVDWLEAYTIVEIDGIRVGIIGIIGEVESSILSANLVDYEFVDAEDIVKDLAIELRTTEECDVVLVASHGDDYYLTTTLAEFDGNAAIDGIFTGHTHTPTDDEYLRDDGRVVCILQNGGYGDSFATLTLEFDENGQLKDTDGKLNNTDNFTADESLSSVFEKYEEYMEIGNAVLFTCDSDVSRYDVGIEIVHAMYLKYDTDFAIINSGGVRASIEAGEVTYADVFQILPFENEVYLITLSGEMLKSCLRNSGGIYYWGINVDYIEDSQDYRIAIVDFLYLSDAFSAYRNDSCVDTNYLVRDVLLDLIKGNIS